MAHLTYIHVISSPAEYLVTQSRLRPHVVVPWRTIRRRLPADNQRLSAGNLNTARSDALYTSRSGGAPLKEGSPDPPRPRTDAPPPPEPRSQRRPRHDGSAAASIAASRTARFWRSATHGPIASSIRAIVSRMWSTISITSLLLLACDDILLTPDASNPTATCVTRLSSETAA